MTLPVIGNFATISDRLGEAMLFRTKSEAHQFLDDRGWPEMEVTSVGLSREEFIERHEATILELYGKWPEVVLSLRKDCHNWVQRISPDEWDELERSLLQETQP